MRYLICFLLLTSAVFADDSVYNENEIKNCVENALDAFNQQNCGSYSSFFTKSCQEKVRRDSGMFFASNNASAKFKECHILTMSEDVAEAAIAYDLSPGGSKVSRVFFEKEDGIWRIRKELLVKQPEEQVASKGKTTTSNPFVGSRVQNNQQQPSQSQSKCANGKCGVRVPFNISEACKDYGFDLPSN